MKICVTTIYTDDMKDIANITAFDNFRKYCIINNYDLEIVNMSGRDIDRPVAWYKILEVKRILLTNKYDWVFFIDLDCLFMNNLIKLESFVDDSNFIIMPSNPDVQDHHMKNSYGDYGVASCQFLIKNCDKSIEFLDDIWLANDLPKDLIDKHDWEQRQFRYSVVKDNFKEGVKIIEPKLLNTYWYTNNIFFLMKYKNYNDNIWKIGDFIVHVPGLHRTERVRVISDLSYYSGGLISNFNRDKGVIKFSTLENLDNITINILDTNRNIISKYIFTQMLIDLSYWISLDEKHTNVIFESYNRDGLLISTNLIK